MSLSICEIILLKFSNEDFFIKIFERSKGFFFATVIAPIVAFRFVG